eukprot:TRINITY_DN7088_c0_g2_i1.p1 TRINITY_DN7088_c0_g2~~TRINITY_DN7088_c0_g2_i1.p1  ORF type:complete len:1300 (+),score=174.19 TRINITY_DN7088_c0_g2_i1:128-4027(+)
MLRSLVGSEMCIRDRSIHFQSLVLIWDLDSGEMIGSVSNSECSSAVVLISATQTPIHALATATTAGIITVFNTHTLEMMSVFRGHESCPQSVLFGGAGQPGHLPDLFDNMIFSSDQSQTHMWQWESGKLERTQPSGAEQLVMTPCRSYLISRNTGVLMMYKLVDMTLHGLFAHPDGLQLASFALMPVTGQIVTISVSNCSQSSQPRLQLWEFPHLFEQHNPTPAAHLSQDQDPAHRIPNPKDRPAAGEDCRARRGSTIGYPTARGRDRLLGLMVHPTEPILAVASRSAAKMLVWTNLPRGLHPTRALCDPGLACAETHPQGVMKCGVLLPSCPGHKDHEYKPDPNPNPNPNQSTVSVRSDWPVLLLAGMGDGSCMLVDLATKATLASFVANSDLRAVSCIAIGFLSISSVLPMRNTASISPDVMPSTCLCQRCGELFDKTTERNCTAHSGKWGLHWKPSHWRNIGKGKTWSCCKASQFETPGCTAVPHLASPVQEEEEGHAHQLAAVVYTGSTNGEVRCHTMGGARLHVLKGHSGAVSCVSATQLSDGQSSLVLTGATDRTVHVWVMRHGSGPELMLRLVAPQPPISVWLSDQTQTHVVAVLESGETVVWAIERGQQVSHYQADEQPRGLGLGQDRLVWGDPNSNPTPNPNPNPMVRSEYSFQVRLTQCHDQEPQLEITVSPEKLLSKLRNLTERAQEQGFPPGWMTANTGDSVRGRAQPETDSMKNCQQGLALALQDAIPDRSGDSWLNALRAALIMMPNHEMKSLFETLWSQPTLGEFPVPCVQALLPVQDRVSVGYHLRHGSDQCGHGSDQCRDHLPLGLATERLVFSTALCAILFGVPDPKIATLAKQLFQITSLQSGMGLSVKKLVSLALDQNSTEMRQGAVALAEQRQLGPQGMLMATDSEADQASHVFLRSCSTSFELDVACLVLLTTSQLQAPKLLHKAALHLGTMLSFKEYEHMLDLFVRLLNQAMLLLDQECGWALDEIIQVLVSSVVHAPKSAPVAGSAVTSIAMSFPEQVTRHLIGLLHRVTKDSVQITQAACTLLIAMLAQSTEGHPVQLHAKRLISSLISIVRRFGKNGEHVNLVAEVSQLVHTMVAQCCNVDWDSRTSLIAVSSLESMGVVDLFDLAAAEHRFSLPSRGGDEAAVEMVCFSKHDYLMASFAPCTAELALWRLITCQSSGPGPCQVTEVKHELTCKVKLDSPNPTSPGPGSPLIRSLPPNKTESVSPVSNTLYDSSPKLPHSPRSSLDSVHSPNALSWDDSGTRLRVWVDHQAYSVNVVGLLEQARQARQSKLSQ